MVGPSERSNIQISVCIVQTFQREWLLQHEQAAFFTCPADGGYPGLFAHHRCTFVWKTSREDLLGLSGTACLVHLLVTGVEEAYVKALKDILNSAGLLC